MDTSSVSAVNLRIFPQMGKFSFTSFFILCASESSSAVVFWAQSKTWKKKKWKGSWLVSFCHLFTFYNKPKIMRFWKLLLHLFNKHKVFCLLQCLRESGPAECINLCPGTAASNKCMPCSGVYPFHTLQPEIQGTVVFILVGQAQHNSFCPLLLNCCVRMEPSHLGNVSFKV